MKKIICLNGFIFDANELYSIDIKGTCEVVVTIMLKNNSIKCYEAISKNHTPLKLDYIISELERNIAKTINEFINGGEWDNYKKPILLDLKQTIDTIVKNCGNDENGQRS